MELYVPNKYDHRELKYFKIKTQGETILHDLHNKFIIYTKIFIKTITRDT